MPDSFGHCVCEDTTILVAKKQSESQKRETLVHEIEHAIWDVAGLCGTGGEEAPLEGLSEEDIVKRTSPIRLAVYADNPKLRRILFGDAA